MPVLDLLVKFGLYLIMVVSALAAIGVVLLPRIFHAALALVIVLIGIAAVFVALHADFLAAVQILVYVGAVMTLIIFAIMLTERLTDRTIRQTNGLAFPGILCSIAFLVIVGRLIYATPWNIRPETLAHRVTVTEIGAALMNAYVFPFEVISVVLIAALIGAIVIARKNKTS